MAPTSTATSTAGEKDPLLLSSSPGSKFYFLNKQDESYQGGLTNSVRDDDGGVEAEFAPRGTTEDEFAPRLIVPKVRIYLFIYFCFPVVVVIGVFIVGLFLLSC